MTLLYPAFLVLLLLAVPLYYWARHTFAYLSRPQRVVSLILRLAMLVLLVLALAGARWKRNIDRMGVMFVVDVSDSIPADLQSETLEMISEAVREKPKDDLVGLVIVGSVGAIDLFPASALLPESITRPEVEVERNFTNLADGLKLAASSLPPGIQKRVVLITDGAENLGDVLSEATRAIENGVELTVFPLRPSYGAEAEVDMLYAPGSVGEGETAGLRMVFSSTVKQKARVLLLVDGDYLGEAEIGLTAGKNSLSFPVRDLTPGFHSFAVVLEPDEDTTLENNQAFAFTRVAGRAGVLIASDDRSDAGVLDSTLAEHDIDSVRLPSQGLPLELSEWLSYDTTILSGIPAYELSESQMDQIASTVRDFGHGMIMIGGEDSFGPGGYYKTKIEEALPVSMDFRRHLLSPNLAIMLLVDKSGSMGMMYSGYEKVAMAREACINVVELAEPGDQVGVLTFDSLPKWVVSPSQEINKVASINKIRTIRAGGGTEIYPSLVEAEKVMSGIDAKLKHVILLSDGMSAPGDFSGILKNLVEGGVTVSTVAIGRDSDLRFMEGIAEMGGGNAYFTDDPYDLPRIFTRETFMMNKGTIVETEFPAVPSSDHALLEGIAWEEAPPLLGYVSTTEKPAAEVVLRTPMADPLLAIWRYGLGKSAAFTSDAKNRWAAHWLGWEGYEKFWSALVRATSASAGNPSYRARVDLDHNRGIVTMEVLGERTGVDVPVSADARIVAPDMSEMTIPLTQVGAGKFEGDFPVGANGTYLVNVVGHSPDGDSSVTAGLAVSYSPEYKKLGADDFVLDRLIKLGTEIDLTGNSLFKVGRRPEVQHYPAWELLILIALYLWLLDVAVRRVMWSREYLDLAAESFRVYSERLRQARIRRGIIRENISIGALTRRIGEVRGRFGLKKTEPEEEAPTGTLESRSGAERPSAKKVVREEAPRVEWGRATTKEADSESRASYHVQAKRKMTIRPQEDSSDED